MSRVAFALAVASALIHTASASTAQDARAPAFEVASVRLWAPGTPISQRITETRVDITNRPLRSVLLLAFGIREDRLFAPEWLESVRVNIQATVSEGATRQQVPDMLQRLLTERFGLVARREMRLLDAFELAVAPDGAKLREVEPLDEFDKYFPRHPGFTTAAAIQQADTVADTPNGPVRTVMGDMSRTSITARSMYTLKTNVERRTQTLEATRMTMAELAAVLANNLNQPVVDATALTGLYQFTLDLPLDATWIAVLRRNGSSLEPAAMTESESVRSLGLTLQKRRLPLEVVIVDRIERTPTPN